MAAKALVKKFKVKIESAHNEVPPELAKSFRGHKDAKAKWDKLAYSHRRQYALWITEAKQEETRRRRAHKAIQMLLAGKTVN